MDVKKIKIKGKEYNFQDEKSRNEIQKINTKISNINWYVCNCTYSDLDKNYLIDLNDLETLPDIFTITFRATNDYIENSKIKIKDKEYEMINCNFKENEIATVNIDNVNNKCYFL